MQELKLIIKRFNIDTMKADTENLLDEVLINQACSEYMVDVASKLYT